MNKFAVIGYPVEHSKSPIVHQLFAKQFSLDICYDKIESPPGYLTENIKKFILLGGSGLNVTVPFKESVLKICDHISPAGQHAMAVNTILFKQGKIYGDNTDGVGLVRDIETNHQISLKNKKILLIGAGGAAKGVLHPIILQKPSSIKVVNRTLEKAKQLANRFSCYGVDITATSFDELNNNKDSYEVIINATSASLYGQGIELSDDIFLNTIFAYDMMYKKNISFFLKQAKSHNIKIADGLGMLVEQAAESFNIWLGVKPKTNSVINIIRERYI